MRLALLVLLLVVTAMSVNAQETRLAESFDGVSPPDLPSGWAGDWSTSVSSAGPGSGGANLMDSGTGSAWVTTPAFSLESVTSAEVGWLARRTASYPAEAVRVAFLAGEDAFPVSVNALPAEAGSWEPVTVEVPAAVLGEASVQIRFDSAGGSSSGSNARLDDIAVTVSSTATGGILGWATNQDDLLGGADLALLSLDLMWDGPGELHGLEFGLSADPGPVALTGFLRGDAVGDPDAWTLGFEGGRALLLSTGAGGLEPGSYTPLLHAVVATEVVEDTAEVQLSITGLTASLATPEGDDAGLSASGEPHLIRVLPRVGLLEVPDSLGFGALEVGTSTDQTLWLRNAGSAALTVDSLGTTSGAFVVAAGPLQIAPGDSAAVAVTFAPRRTDRGSIMAWLTVGGQYRTELHGFGLLARGEVTGDESVDVTDIVHGVDLVLGRVTATETTAVRLDLHPFPLGDGALDVRDLTVLTQAVLRGLWPDGEVLDSPQWPASKGGVPTVRADGGVVSVYIGAEVRGLQAEFAVEGRAVRMGPVSLHQQGSLVRLVWAPSDGSHLPEGRSILFQALEARFLGGLFVAPGLTRGGLTAEVPSGVDEAPFPNPFSISRDRGVQWPGVEAIHVFDLLGREVWEGPGTWPGIDRGGRHVAPGLYILDSGRRRRSLVVLN